MLLASFFTGACAYAAQVPCLLLHDETKITTATINKVVVKCFFIDLILSVMANVCQLLKFTNI
jgi:hypothetical protein